MNGMAVDRTIGPEAQPREQAWYKSAVMYELHVKSFHDMNDDGIGDFQGLLSKLDYIEELGVTAIWLLPFYPSPLKDDGYDIADYLDVMKEYGSLRDFRRFLREAHDRGLRVITELVVNHTSDQHSWFQRARRSRPGSVWRNYYIWSDSPNKFREARIIFKDFESSNWAWDPIAQSYYFHRFYFHQPDLNYDSPHVQREVMRIVDFWLDMGVDGLRLDAIPYLYKREGTNCENLPEVHAFIKKLRAHIDAHYSDRVLLAEANQWPEDAVAYFGNGDECHMAFHFPVMPRLFMALGLEDRYPLMDIFRQTPHIPETCQWVLFLRNHDELTLEMVTDEERTFMYHSYALDVRARINLGIRRRLASLLENNRRKIELMNAILFSLPGIPVVYYGDEIGMGDNYYLGDRDGVRTPMQWSPDRNAGFSRASPHRLDLPVIIEPEYHYESLNVENQNRNASSLLWWMKRIIDMRKRYPAFWAGATTFLNPGNPKIFSFIRKFRDEVILIVANVSRFPQYVELDLSEFTGYTPEEVFGGAQFPVIKKYSYVLTCGSYECYWFALLPPRESPALGKAFKKSEVVITTEWLRSPESTLVNQLERFLPDYFRECRWFGGKNRKLQRVKILEALPLETTRQLIYMLYCQVQYGEGRPETYFLPVSFAAHEEASELINEYPRAVIARLRATDAEGILFDAVYGKKERLVLFTLLEQHRKFRIGSSVVQFIRGESFRRLRGDPSVPMESKVHGGQQSNTSVVYGNSFFFKLFRKAEEIANPEVEMLRFLNEATGFRHLPPFAGMVRWLRRPSAEPIVLGIAQGLVPNARDCWGLALDELERYYERVLAQGDPRPAPPELPPSPFKKNVGRVPGIVTDASGSIFFQLASLIGTRTAELHTALSLPTGNVDFDPEPFTYHYQRSLYQSMDASVRRSLSMLKRACGGLSADVQKEAEAVLAAEGEIAVRLKKIIEHPFTAQKIRIHGDYHLSQVLYDGKDITIIDFEGEVARPMDERRLKRCPLQDAAGMVRSFHYASIGVFFLRTSIRREDAPHLGPWASLWFHWMSAAFLTSYLDIMRSGPLLPSQSEEIETLFMIFLLDKALYELTYELSNRPEWVIIPLRGLRHILDAYPVASPQTGINPGKE